MSVTLLLLIVKIKLPLWLNKHHSTETYWSVKLWFNMLTSALYRGEWSASRHGRFNPRKRNPVSIGEEAEWAQSRSGCDGEEKNSNPCRE
jgi:hypothetical protein